MAKFSSYLIEIEWWQSFHYIYQLHRINNIQSVQYVICVMIVRGLWNIGLAIRYTIWIVAHLCTSRGTFLRINGKTTLSPLDAIWLALRILAGNEHCIVCDGNMVSEYLFNFLWPLINECIQNMFVAFANICSVSMPNFTSIWALGNSNQTPKVWNFAGDVHIGFFHSLVFKDSTTFRSIELSHYWSYRYNSFCILLWILLMWKPFEILMIFELFLDQILWRARNK